MKNRTEGQGISGTTQCPICKHLYTDLEIRMARFTIIGTRPDGTVWCFKCNDDDAPLKPLKKFLMRVVK